MFVIYFWCHTYIFGDVKDTISNLLIKCQWYLKLYIIVEYKQYFFKLYTYLSGLSLKILHFDSNRHIQSSQYTTVKFVNYISLLLLTLTNTIIKAQCHAESHTNCLTSVHMQSTPVTHSCMHSIRVCQRVYIDCFIRHFGANWSSISITPMGLPIVVKLLPRVSRNSYIHFRLSATITAY